MKFSDLLAAKLDLLVSWLLTSGIRTTLILLVAFLALRGIRLLSTQFDRILSELTGPSLERQKRTQTLSYVVRTGATAVLIIVTVMLLLAELGVDIAPLLAAAGIGGLAIGIGAQNLVRDIITGFFLLLEDQIRVGDVVKVGDKQGQVEGIGLRILTLRDFDGSVHTIPNGTITTVTNMTKDFSYAVLPVSVSPREDIDTVIQVLTDVGAELRQSADFSSDILSNLEVSGVDEVTGSRVTITVRIKTLPSKQWRVNRELRRRIKDAFNAHQIEMA
jgi:small conductance mechanosensitive channel